MSPGIPGGKAGGGDGGGGDGGGGKGGSDPEPDPNSIKAALPCRSAGGRLGGEGALALAPQTRS